MLRDRGAQILAQFPGPVTVRPILTLSVGAFIAAPALIAIACVWGIWHLWPVTNGGTRAMWFCAAVCGFVSAGAASMLRTNSMTIDREGFEIVDGLLMKKRRYQWKNVSVFERQYLPRRSYFVAFDEAGRGDGIFAAVNHALGFRNSSLLEDYGLGEDQLAELLNHWRDRALANASN
jgi:hypothetical protein